MVDLGLLGAKEFSGVHLGVIASLNGGSNILLGFLPKESFVVSNHLLDVLLGCHVKDAVGVKEEVHAKMECDGP